MKNRYFANYCLITVRNWEFFCTHVTHIVVAIFYTTNFVCTKSNFSQFQISLLNFAFLAQNHKALLQGPFLKKMLLRVESLFVRTDPNCHVWCKLKRSYTCWITVNFGTPKDDSLKIIILASNNCLSHRNLIQHFLKNRLQFFAKKLKILYIS